MKDIDNKVKEIIVQSVLKQKYKSTYNAYIHNKVLTEAKDIEHLQNNIFLKHPITDVNQACVFIDKKPHLNWAHECEYRMYNGISGEHLETIAARMPPISFLLNSNDYEPVGSMIQRPQKAIENIQLSPIKALDKALCNKGGERYAILFSGLTQYRHLNDLEYMYRTLVYVYNFKPENITVLSCVGTLDYCVDPNDPPFPKDIWPGDNTPYKLIVNGEGSRSAFINALDKCKENLKKDDLLLIHTNGHGEGPKAQGDGTMSSIVCMPDSDPTSSADSSEGQAGVPSFSSEDFADSLKSLPEFNTLVVMMEQCHSGGFSEPTIASSKAENTSFSAACLSWKESVGEQKFDPYAFYWISKLATDNTSDIENAYDYASKNTDPMDTPNEKDKPENCSNDITLTGIGCKV